MNTALTRSTYYLISMVLLAVFVFPLVWTALTSVKPPLEASAIPPTFLPSHLTWENYTSLAAYAGGITRYVLNSAIVALLTVLGTILVSALGGYGFARFQFPGKAAVFILMLLPIMIPFQIIITPLFLIMFRIHLADSLIGLALVYMTFQLPFSLFIMRNSFESIPRELQEAALLDGCTLLTALFRVELLIVRPAFITVGLFAFINAWNEFLAALILMTNSNHYTLPVSLLNAQYGTLGIINWGALQAGVTLSMLPCVVLFLLLQRYYVSGLVTGAVK
jgi:multiple sugar transport system permease protein